MGPSKTYQTNREFIRDQKSKGATNISIFKSLIFDRGVEYPDAEYMIRDTLNLSNRQWASIKRLYDKPSPKRAQMDKEMLNYLSKILN